METATLEVTATEDRTSQKEREVNERAKKAAVNFLHRRGFEILERDWLCHNGTMDIICRDEDALVFVDVKARADAAKGFPSDKVDQKKRERFEKIAMSYLQGHVEDDMRVRFDVISIVVLSRDRAFLRHHVNAFGTM